MTSAELDNLVRIGKLKREPPSARELQRTKLRSKGCGRRSRMPSALTHSLVVGGIGFRLAVREQTQNGSDSPHPATAAMLTANSCVCRR